MTKFAGIFLGILMMIAQGMILWLVLTIVMKVSDATSPSFYPFVVLFTLSVALVSATIWFFGRWFKPKFSWYDGLGVGIGWAVVAILIDLYTIYSGISVYTPGAYLAEVAPVYISVPLGASVATAILKAWSRDNPR